MTFSTDTGGLEAWSTGMSGLPAFSTETGELTKLSKNATVLESIVQPRDPAGFPSGSKEPLPKAPRKSQRVTVTRSQLGMFTDCS